MSLNPTPAATLAAAPSSAHPFTGAGPARSGATGARQAHARPVEPGTAAQHETAGRSPFGRVLQDATRQQAHPLEAQPEGKQEESPATRSAPGRAAGPAHQDAHPFTGAGPARSGTTGARQAHARPVEPGTAANHQTAGRSPFGRVLQDGTRQQAHPLEAQPDGKRAESPATRSAPGSAAGPAHKDESTVPVQHGPNPLLAREHPAPDDSALASAPTLDPGRGLHGGADIEQPAPGFARPASAPTMPGPASPADRGRATLHENIADRPGAAAQAVVIAAWADPDAAASRLPDPDHRTRPGAASAAEGAPPPVAEPGGAAWPVATELTAAADTHGGTVAVAGPGGTVVVSGPSASATRPLSAAERRLEPASDTTARTGLPAPGPRSPALAAQTPGPAEPQPLPTRLAPPDGSVSTRTPALRAAPAAIGDPALQPGSGSVPAAHPALDPDAPPLSAAAPGGADAAPGLTGLSVEPAVMSSPYTGAPGAAPPPAAAHTTSPSPWPARSGAEALTGDAQAREAEPTQPGARPIPQPLPVTGDGADPPMRAGASAADAGPAGLSAAVHAAAAAAGTPAGAAASARALAAAWPAADTAAAAAAFSLATGAGTVTTPPPAVAPPEVRLPVPPGHAAFAGALGAQVALFVREGVHTARLQLNPAELGPITVQIALEGASARVHLAAEHALTRQALEQAMPTLAGNLRDSGLTLTGGGVSDQPRDAQPQSGAAGDGTRRGPDAAPFGSTTGPEGAAADEAISRERPWGAPRGIVDLVA